MQDFEKLRQAKAQCVKDLSEHLTDYADRLNDIDGRLVAYIEDAISNGASHANLYELLGIRKEFRLMDSYALDPKRVRMTMQAIEGIWKNGRHVKGGLKFDTPRGNQHVRLMPYQVWCLFGIYGFKVDVDMERRYVEGDELLPTEWVKDGEVWDTRRLTDECHLFQTRKSGKTEFGGAIDFVEVCFLGPANGQALICAPSAEQSRIAYEAIRDFAMQIDPTCINRMGGKLFRMTRNGMNWQPGNRMKGEIKCMAAGKTSKDGLYASVVHADEHGQPGYINGHCDMQAAVETCWGSTGPRREKLLMHTTTAGRIQDGPYKSKIETVEGILLRELDYPLGEARRTDDDTWFAFLLQLDKWEVTDDIQKLNDTELFRKVNRSIGTTVQPDYYRKRLHEAVLSEDTKQEILTKDFNIWQTGRVTQWMKGDSIRPLQIQKRITDCKYDEGWQVFVGLDFGGKDDLWAASYLGVNYRQDAAYEDRYFADCDVFITEVALQDSPNRPLYERWVADGWLHVCPGEVFNPDMAINEIMAKHEAGLNLFMFAYDPAQSKQPLNTLKAWLQTLGIDVQTINKMVVPCSQGGMNMNGLIGQLESMILDLRPWIRFSANPLWPWCFGNCGVYAGKDGTSSLRRIEKMVQSQKIDIVHGLLDALYAFNLSEGNIQD